MKSIFLQVIRSPLLLFRVVIFFPFLILSLVADFFKSFGRLSEVLEDWIMDMASEFRCWTTPSLFKTFEKLKGDAEEAKRDADNMREFCRINKESIDRAKDIEYAKVRESMPPWPVIEWPEQIGTPVAVKDDLK